MDTSTRDTSASDAKALERALELIPNARLAEKVGVSPQAVSNWERVPAERVIAVAEATDWRVLPHELRGDIYRYPQDGLPPNLRAEPQAA